MHGPYRVIRNAPYPLRRKDSGTTLNLSKDGGALAAATNTPAETPAASGIYYNELTATEMSCDHLFYKGNAGASFDTGTLVPEPAFDSGVAQGGSSTTITLRAAGPSFGLVGTMVEIVRGTGKDSTPRMITDYDTTTKVATVRPDWSTTPDNTSVYIVFWNPKVNVMQIDGAAFPAQALSELYLKNYKTGTISSGSTTTVIKTTLTGYGTSAFVGSFFMCAGTTNYGLIRPIVGYNTSTGDITVFPAFPSAPLNTEGAVVLGAGG